MNVVDVNLLLYAYDAASPLHRSASTWIANEFSSRETTGLSLHTLLAFTRIASSMKIVAQPLSIDEACSLVDEWLAYPYVTLLAPSPGHWQTFVRTAVRARARGNLVPDADLAAVAIEHGATLCTHDRDFRRFEGLRVSFPLAAARASASG